jgi:hypothetical protein
MKDYKYRQLEKELKDAGANQSELRQLLPIAASLGSLKNNSEKAGQTFRVLKFARPFGFVASGLVAGMFLVIVSQAALPTSWLYPVQKFSDAVAINLHSQYRATVMMKRAQQVNELVADHASSKRVLATLADYMGEASTYKSTPHANYAAFEYCKSNLQQAAVAAPINVRQAISSSLQSLGTT